MLSEIKQCDDAKDNVRFGQDHMAFFQRDDYDRMNQKDILHSIV